MPSHPPTSPLLASLADIPETNLVPAKYLAGGSIGAQIAYGLESSMMIAVRQPDYHSRPHSHDAEQLNHVLDGQLYVFVDDHGFLARKGDIFRIPRGAVHWSWVQGDTPCVLLETHTPPLIGDEGVLDGATALIAPGEPRDTIVAVPSIWPQGVDQGAVERRVVSASRD
jgi:quercetin dioxygenase-like cupin family protein